MVLISLGFVGECLRVHSLNLSSALIRRTCNMWIHIYSLVLVLHAEFFLRFLTALEWIALNNLDSSCISRVFILSLNYLQSLKLC